MSNRWGTVHDNEIIIDFNIMIDTDMGIYQLIRRKYANDPHVDKEFIKSNNELAVLFTMINRRDINPLSIIMPKYNTDNLYKSILEENKDEVLSLSKPTDLFYLMNTYKNNASSINIVVHCNDDIELSFLKNIFKMMNMDFKIICSPKEETSLKGFTTIYTKNFIDLDKYKDLDAKNIYIASTIYNMISIFENTDVYKEITKANVIRTIDMFTKVKAEESLLSNILEEEDKK